MHGFNVGRNALLWLAGNSPFPLTYGNKSYFFGILRPVGPKSSDGLRKLKSFDFAHSAIERNKEIKFILSFSRW